MHKKKRISLLISSLCICSLFIIIAFSATAFSAGLPSDQAWELRQLAIGSGNGYNIYKWENAGPNGIGRVFEIELDPRNDNTLYVAPGTGSGLWKSTDGGATFKCLSNNLKSQSFGDVALDPQNPDIVWIGGGECIGGGDFFPWPGAGIYRSPDGGATWEHKGLDSSFFISRIRIHPTNSNIVFAGVMGNLFSTNPQRGVYRTTDGGATWKRVFYVNDSTGCVDLMIYTNNPNRIIASLWTCIRHPYSRKYSSPHCVVWKSEDGGETWTSISGFPSAMGKICFDMCRDNPDIMYLSYLNSASDLGGARKSTDGGATWQAMATPQGDFAYYGFMFNRVYVNPKNANEAVLCGITIDRTTNGGVTWNAAKFPSSNHVNYYAVAWGSQNNSIVYVGDGGGIRKCSGGIGSSLTNLGVKELSTGGLAMAQTNGIDVAKDDQDYRMAGLQGNGVCATLTGAQYGWTERVVGGGAHCRINPFNTNIALASTHALYMTVNKNTWSSIVLDTGRQKSGVVAFDSKNGRAFCANQFVWTAPVGSTAFIRTDTTDLTNGNHTMAGTVDFYGSVTALAAYNGVCYAGTDDGNVWYSKNAAGSGATWKKIRDGLITSGTDERTKFDGWITNIWVDESDSTGATAFVCVWYHRWGLNYYKPVMYKLTNLGHGGVGSADWKDISGDLPCFITTHKVVKDNFKNWATTGYYYCATDYGMFYSPNEGINWKWLGDSALPIIPCTDITLNFPNTIFVGSYGRGMWKMDLSWAQHISNQKDLSSKGNQTLYNYPNPAVTRTSIKFKVKDNQKVSVGIYDLSGQLVKMVYAHTALAEKLNTTVWDVTNASGKKVASGNYICRLIGDKVTLARMITVKR